MGKAKPSVVTLARFTLSSLPSVSGLLGRWERRASLIPEKALRDQALASIAKKRFHCQGGASYAVPCGPFSRTVIEAIVAYQTISDYLDNLCDRAGVYEEDSFRQLHLAMEEALQASGPLSDYYSLYPWSNDGGYLRSLVTSIRASLSALPSFDAMREPAVAQARLYTDLQALKHLGITRRKEMLIDWYREKGRGYPEIRWWEFAAASGSTLGIFALMSLATRESTSEAEIHETCQAYFPYIAGLHILLDYLIDMEEDAREGDLNLVAMYTGKEERRERLAMFVREALVKSALLPNASFHQTVVKGLLALYLSDPKVREQGLTPLAHELLSRGGPGTAFMNQGCLALRSVGAI